MKTRKIRRFLILAFLTLGVKAYGQSDSTAFRANLINKEYDVFLNVDFYGKGLDVPYHELYGPLPGYLGKPTNTFYWLILDAEVSDDKATLQMVNDYGSEDLVATLRQLNDSTYRLTQEKGSSIKVPHKGKWMKLPKSMDFKKQAVGR